MRRHRTLLVGLLCLAVGYAAAVFVDPRTSPSASAGERDRALPQGSTVASVHTNQPLVALTFDDGPDPRWTPRVLELLRRYQATATFFDVGRNAIAYPALVQAEMAGGHEIGDHTWSHADLQTLGPSAVQAEIARGAQALVTVGVPPPHLFRPPYGSTDEAVGVVADANLYRTVFWNVALEHFVNHTPDVAAGVHRMLDRMHAGSIVLAHDGGVPDRTRTMEALPLLLDGIRARGWRVVDVDTLLRAARPPLPALPPAA